MTPPSTPPAPPPSEAGSTNSAGDGSGFARAEALSGLAREVDVLRRALDQTAGEVAPLPGRLEEVTALVGQLTDAVAAMSTRAGPTAAPSWLMAPDDPALVEQVLAELCAWLHAIFLRYPDGATALPPCWLCHPDVVEELLWLMHAWCAAYQGRAASVQLAGDWHDRQRPGVVRRIRQSAGSCSPERHLTRPDWDQYPAGAAPVPAVDTVASIAAWWAGHRDGPAPEPRTAQPARPRPQRPQPAASAPNGWNGAPR